MVQRNRQRYYPGTSTEITAPLFIYQCACGRREWFTSPERVTPEYKCPVCGRPGVRQVAAGKE
ncbi:hypothetical protein E5357_06245 [Hominisplanchenecus murintestinalis]|uniref:Uncharacterized protein n=1 Tax=Hominisplanchenecus murintestinalis TaxID=2941517 RepID=A0AC61R0S8_9FIRM|nr:hypothetical protein [Hominisplanchenecus murintestinalis]MDE6907330.1 hypothetical protein [Lachnospiraceae bacterium]TGX99205.1 hypothetical protein E5357_06245 [Hominisplanchenecus murintestinalis]